MGQFRLHHCVQIVQWNTCYQCRGELKIQFYCVWLPSLNSSKGSLLTSTNTKQQISEICPESTSHNAVSYLDDQYQSGKSASRFDAKVSTKWWYKNSHDTDNDVFFTWCVYKSELSFPPSAFGHFPIIFSGWWTWWPRWWTNQCQLSIGFWTQTKRCQRFFVLLFDCLIFVLFVVLSPIKYVRDQTTPTILMSGWR